MMWCVTIEMVGEPARVVGPFRTRGRAEAAWDDIERELADRGITEGVAPSVALMFPGSDPKEALT